MRTYSGETLALLASGNAAVRDLVLFDFPSGLYGFWNGSGTFEHESIPYTGAGSLISADPIVQVADLSSMPLILRLTAVPNSDLNPDTLATIEQEQYHQRPVTISRAYIDPNKRTVLSVERIYRGYVDKIEHETEAGGKAELVCYLESKARDHTKQGYRTRADADQRRVAANDGSFRHAATADSLEIFWGRATPKPAKA